MSIAVIIQLASLLVVAAIGVCVVYAIFEMREVYAEQRAKFLHAIGAVEELQKMQPQFVALLQRVESDGQALQQIATQIEAAIAELNDSIGIAMTGAATRQAAALESLRDHLDSQEERLATILENMTSAPPMKTADGSNGNGNGNGDYARLRKEVLTQDPQMRFSVLRDWLSKNTLAILHRASRGWTTPNDLIVNIPADLEPLAELNNDGALRVGTRGYPETVTIDLGYNPASDEKLSRRTLV